MQRNHKIASKSDKSVGENIATINVEYFHGDYITAVIIRSFVNVVTRHDEKLQDICCLKIREIRD